MENNIIKVLDRYKSDIKEIEESDLSDLSNVALGIQISRTCIHTLRVILRQGDFKNIDTEIHFFKTQKPYTYGRLKFYAKLYKYILHKPSGSIKKQRRCIDEIMEKLEVHKTKNIDFLKYYNLGETQLDKYYFVRGKDNLNLISDTYYYYTDPEFSTSHDMVVAQLIAYQLLVSYFNSELDYLRKKETALEYNEPSFPAIFESLSWTGSKTDLVELIYALQSSGAIRNGQIEIKKIAIICEKLFDLDLGNFYRTYLEIRERKMDRTRFINLLKQSLEKRMNEDDEKY